MSVVVSWRCEYVIKMINNLLVNFFSPSNDNQTAQFYDHVLVVLKKEDLAYEDKIILGGDFNCPMNPMLDKQGGIIITRKKNSGKY